MALRGLGEKRRVVEWGEKRRAVWCEEKRGGEGKGERRVRITIETVAFSLK
jgi:hypothetical protein